MSRRLPKYVTEFRDRHGKMRTRFRRKGQADHYFQHVPWTPEFMSEYQACLSGETASAIVPGANRTKAGTFNALIVAYYGSSEFKQLAESTRRAYRGVLERFRAKHGEKRVAALERKHVKAIIGGMSETPEAANNLLDRLRTLMRLALDLGMRVDDPTMRVRGYKSSGDGYHTWTEEEISAFEVRHPVGSKAHLAMALLLFTAQRKGDVVTMGWQHVIGDKISVRQQKTDERLKIPMHAALREALKEYPRDNLTFLVTGHGKPFTPAGFGNWFRDRCNEANLPQCSAHGLRKAAARRLAEAGCTNQMIKAVTGHRTDAEVSRYTKAADQVRLAEQAMKVAYGSDGEQKPSNSS